MLVQIIPARFDRLGKIGQKGKPAYEINFATAYRSTLGIPENDDRPIILSIAGRRYLSKFSHRKNLPSKIYLPGPLKSLDPDEPSSEPYKGSHTVGTILYTRHGLTAPDQLQLQVSDIPEREGATLLVEVLHAKLSPTTPEILPRSTTIDSLLSSAGAGFGDPESNAIVEKAAVDFVTAKYSGWDVNDVSKKDLGYDLECTRGSEVRHIEVKGVSGTREEFIITQNEAKTAKSDPKFVLAVVTTAASLKPCLHEYSGSELFERFDLITIAYNAKPKKLTD